jgi:hypothetical protein
MAPLADLSGVNDHYMVEYLVPLWLNDDIIIECSPEIPPHGCMDGWLGIPHPLTYIYRNACRSSMSDFNLNGMCQQILVELPSMKFHEIHSMILDLLHANRWTDIAKLIGTYL